MTKTAARKTANECCQGESKGMAVDNIAKNGISLSNVRIFQGKMNSMVM